MIEDICPFEHHDDISPCIICNAISITRTQERLRMLSIIEKIDPNAGSMNALGLKQHILGLLKK